MNKDILGCWKSFGIWLIVMSVIALLGHIFTEWKERHPISFCDEVKTVSKYNAPICKLRYPILNADKIKELEEANEKLKYENLSLKIKIENISKSIDGDIQEVSEEELLQIDF